jgi:excisionase family DNA binding protein
VKNNHSPAKQVIYQGTYRFLFPNTGKRARYFSRIHPNSPGHIFERFLQFDDVDQLTSRHRRQLLKKVVSFMQYRIENLVSFEKPLYTVPETANMLSLSRTTIYELIKEGKIRAVYPTSKARIPATSIISFVKKQEEDARLDSQSMGYRS